MFDYLLARMGNMNVDPDSGNYSWDWNGVHYVQQNTWAGDQTSLYFNCGGKSGPARCSDVLLGCLTILQTHVGHTTTPVVLSQHYLFAAVNTSKSLSTSDDDYWPVDENAINAAGSKTGQGYQTWYDIVKSYNVIGLFGGHDHCLGVSSSLLAKLPITGPTYPGAQGYGLPIDNFDDGAGGDTRGTTEQDSGQESAGIGNPCPATKINGKTIPQTAVASFLVTHITPHYLDVAAASWNHTATSRTSTTPKVCPQARRPVASVSIANSFRSLRALPCKLCSVATASAPPQAHRPTYQLPCASARNREPLISISQITAATHRIRA